MPGPDHKAYKGWRGTIAAMLKHHPDKFSKEACGEKIKGKLCPYAIATKEKEEGDTPHYKEQPHTQKGTPHKKPEFKDEDDRDEKEKKKEHTFYRYVQRKDLGIYESKSKSKSKSKKKMGAEGIPAGVSSLNASFDMP